jgi:threonine/homoserine efflux transporter RhtA
MSSDTKGFVLVVVAFLLAFVAVGSVEYMKPDAGFFDWAVVGMALIVSFISGLLGYSYINER